MLLMRAFTGTYIEALGFKIENVQVVAKTYADDSSRIVSESPLSRACVAPRGAG